MLRPLLAVALTASLWVAGGCGGSASPDNSAGGTPAEAAAGQAGASAPVRPAADEPIAAAAQVFVDALLKGDSGRALQLLTPEAQQSFAQYDKAFPPPQGAVPRYTVDQIRRPSEADALVQCFLYSAGVDGQETRQEMCCIMRRVGDQWRVSGMARRIGTNMQMVNFEAAPTPIASPTASPPTATLPPGAQPQAGLPDLQQQAPAPPYEPVFPGVSSSPSESYIPPPSGLPGAAPAGPNQGLAFPGGPARQSPRTAQDQPSVPSR